MIEQNIRAALVVTHIEVRDLSGEHAGHFKKTHEAPSHLDLLVVSPAFEGLSAVQRHRLLHPLIYTGAATDPHAVKIRALTPAEYNRL